jgi:hypothetical protein
MRCLGTFLARCDIETYPITFGERFESIALDLGKVDEHVWSIVLLDKTETLCIVKPFHLTFCHLLLHVSLWELSVLRIFQTPNSEYTGT